MPYEESWHVFKMALIPTFSKIQKLRQLLFFLLSKKERKVQTKKFNNFYKYCTWYTWYTLNASWCSDYTVLVFFCVLAHIWRHCFMYWKSIPNDIYLSDYWLMSGLYLKHWKIVYQIAAITENEISNNDIKLILNILLSSLLTSVSICRYCR